MKNSFFSKFTPKEPKFFHLLSELSDVLLVASTLLQEEIKKCKPELRDEYYKKIKDEERKGDAIAHTIFDELSRTFITPFDREDIHALASHLDDVIDGINSCIKRIAIYNPKPIGAAGMELANFIYEGALCINKAMEELGRFKKDSLALRDYCVRLHDIENKADDVYEQFIKKLFEEEKDPIEIIKIKEIMSEMEKTTDSAEMVGKILKTLIVKYA